MLVAKLQDILLEIQLDFFVVSLGALTLKQHLVQTMCMHITTGIVLIPPSLPFILPFILLSLRACVLYSLCFACHCAVTHCQGFIKGSSLFSFQQNSHVLQQGHPRRDPESHI